ncbi:hypothetical protein L6E12_29870 [Actinokineospora sp. PR83]|nr:hypothetical protein [Actinokineospora sp. PR83]MCG8919987.1 hypothetical protein [Actinokineospora sp. PR83]
MDSEGAASGSVSRVAGARQFQARGEGGVEVLVDHGRGHRPGAPFTYQ